MKLSERLARLGTETAFEVLVRARALEAQGRSVIHLEIGEPDFDTPSHITDAANLGYQELRDLMVERVNGRPVGSLADLRQAFASPNGGFHVVELAAGQAAARLVLDAGEAAAAAARLREAYGVERLDSGAP